MRLTMTNARGCLAVLFAALMVGAPALHASPISPERQTALVMKYCAVCHTDATRNGGLSLEHYDAGTSEPALAAMLLSKLRAGAMGAAGLGVPDKETQEAWIAATTAQAAQAKTWTVIRTRATESEDPMLTASIVREVAPRKNGLDAPLYRVTLACDTARRLGDIQLTWSPVAQVDRTFTVSADGGVEIPQTLVGREEHMGNGAAGTAGLASAKLSSPLPQRTLTVGNLFPGETVEFPIGDLDPAIRRELALCFVARPRE